MLDDDDDAMGQLMIEQNRAGVWYLAASCRDETRATNLSLMCSSLLKGIVDEEEAAVAALVCVAVDDDDDDGAAVGWLLPTTACSDCSS